LSQVEFGKYRIVRQLAQGGMAEIFLARQTGPAGFDKQVVIKRVLPNFADDEEFVRRFLDEARIAARLSHPNIVQVFDFGEVSGMYYLAMEYLDGRDLAAIQSALSRQGRPMPWHIAGLIVSSACEALSYAHTCAGDDGRPLNIVHRDISPSNLFVTYQGAVKVLDFGIAKAEDNLKQTAANVILGKYSYMSPEQLHGDPLDARSDLFALGAVLHECLVGRPTFKRPSTPATIEAILREPIPRPSECGAAVPKELEDIAMRALERDVSARWRSADEMREALDACLAANTSGSPPLREISKFLHKLKSTPSEARATPVNASPRESPPPPPEPSAPEPPSTQDFPRFPRKQSTKPLPGVTDPRRGSSDTRAAADGKATQPTHKSGRKTGAWIYAGLGAIILIVGGLAPLLPSGTRNKPAQGQLDKSVPAASFDAIPGDAAVAPPQPTPPPEPTPSPEPTPTPAATATPGASRPTPTPTTLQRRSIAPPRTAAGDGGTLPLEPPQGTIDVNCVPWCQIYIDGVDTQRHSPARGIAVKPGKHELRVIHPPSGLAQALTIEVKAGATTPIGPIYLRSR
jgi:serine/threonine protein kinase